MARGIFGSISGVSIEVFRLQLSKNSDCCRTAFCAYGFHEDAVDNLILRPRRGRIASDVLSISVDRVAMFFPCAVLFALPPTSALARGGMGSLTSTRGAIGSIRRHAKNEFFRATCDGRRYRRSPEQAQSAMGDEARVLYEADLSARSRSSPVVRVHHVRRSKMRRDVASSPRG